MLNTEDLRRDANPVCMMRSRLMGILVVHLAMEDRVMYPQLMASPNVILATVAKRYQLEVGDYKSQLNIYLEHWRTAEEIQSNPPVFIHETRRILGVLVQRIERENGELYPLIENVQSHRFAKTG